MFASDDGYIQSLSTSYTTAVAGGGTVSVEAANDLRVGQQFATPTFTVRENFLAFDTSSVGADDVQSATLSLDGNADSSDTDFTAEVRIYSYGTLTTADWVVDLSSHTRVATWSSASYSASYNAFTSDATFAENINGSGLTELLIHSDRHRTETEPTGFEVVRFEDSEAAGTTVDPMLVVNHLTPITDAAEKLQTVTSSPMRY